MSPFCSFRSRLKEQGLDLVRNGISTVQVNLGRLCNQACTHCHLEAGPTRKELMSLETVQRLLGLIASTAGVETVDVTGGAPELNPNFRILIAELAARRLRVIVRTNLTVFFEPGMADLPEFYGRRRVHLIASLPCYSGENVDRQRGRGVFKKSIRALQQLNGEGYGHAGSGLFLDLVYNPAGPLLSPPQAQLEAEYKSRLRREFGIEFNRLLTLTNMPIGRFGRMLEREGKKRAYLDLLIKRFNPATVPELMCRSQISVGWDGSLYDCDFNYALGRPLSGAFRTIWEIESFDPLRGNPIITGLHCFGCTAASGSSCGGSLLAAG